jgi:F-type H+-transporting ATPase subunit a
MTGAKVLDTVTPGSGDLWGLPINPQTLLASLIAATVVLGVGLAVRAGTTSGVPGRLQMAAETLVAASDRRIKAATGRTATVAVPLAVSLFVFILVANTMRVLPGTSVLVPTPTADLNLTAALAIIVVGVVHTAAVRRRGLRAYLRHYLQPYWWLLPINLISELVRPITLALRLFATAFAGAMVVALIGELIPPPVAPVPHVIWGLFDLGVGVMQASIFALLALFYYEAALGEPASERPGAFAPAC